MPKKKGNPAGEVARNIQSAFGKDCLNETTLRRYLTKFRSGDMSLEFKTEHVVLLSVKLLEDGREEKPG